MVVGPTKGPQLDLRPAQARDQSAHNWRLSAALKSFLERPVEDEDDDDALYSANEGDVSQGSMSLLDISVSDDEDTRKRKACELACKSDTNFTAWKDKLISDGTTGLQEQDNVVNDYADGGKRKPKNPDFFGPSTMNPLGLCHFYPTDPMIVSMLTSPKLPAKADHIKGLLLLTKTQPRPYIIVVFKGGAITPFGAIAGTAYSECTCSYPYLWPEETKDGHRPRVSCCPFCVYTVQNDPAYLNHIVSAHYNANFTCGTCLSAVTSSCQQMKRHINECKGLDPPMPPSSQGSATPPTASQESAHGGCDLRGRCQPRKHGQTNQAPLSMEKEVEVTQEGQRAHPSVASPFVVVFHCFH